MLKSLRRDKTPLYLIGAMVILWAILHALTGGGFWGPTSYNTYTRQAMAWREGLLHLPKDVPHLELAVYEGEYYVSFPPLPSVILWPLTFLFGMDTPDNLMVKLYALFACLMMYCALKRAGYERPFAAIFAFLFCFASSLLPMTLNGAVWYHAQVLAFFLIIASICLLTLDWPTLALFCYALSICCRPFHARRAKLYYQWAFPEAEIRCVPCREEGVNAEDWHRTEAGRRRVLGELRRLGDQINVQLEELIAHGRA